jgi:hypothetical protein
MTDYGEPKDGDFIAYIERLQEESAARLQLHITLDSHDTSSGPAPVPLPGSTSASAKFAPSAMVAEEIQKRLRAPASSLRFIVSGFAVAVGGFLVLLGFLFNSGALSILIGIGLLIWALPRLRAALGQPGKSKQAVSREIVEHWFGTKPK